MRSEAGSNEGTAVAEGPGRSWSLQHLPWPEVGRALARDPRLILPVGALVQHGPHLPLGTNTFIAERVAEAVSRRCGILLAPTFDYGVWNPGKESYAGSTGVERKTLHRALNELLAKWEDHGIQEFILLTACQHEPHLDALLMAMTSSALTTVVNLFSIDAGDLLAGSPFSEHGGELETSLMLHLAPTWVQPGQAADVAPDPRTYRRYAQGRVATPPPGSRGILGFPSRASSEKGMAVFNRYVESLTEVLSNEPSPSQPGISSCGTQANSHSGQ
ncbi:MAG: creatininase family protein [Gemmatimonadota bacterium]